MGANLLADIRRRGLAAIGGDFIVGEDFMVGALAKAEVFVADNVAAWLWQQRAGRVNPERDFPCIVPPFEFTWIEWKDVWDEGVDRVGVLFACQDFGSDEDGGTDRIASWMARSMANKSAIDFAGSLVPVDPMRWIVYALPCARAIGSGPVGPLKMWCGALTPEGNIAAAEGGHMMNFGVYPEGMEAGAIKAFTQLMTEGFLTLSFLNCKNVVREECLPSRQERRAAERRGEQITRYKTLRIEPMKRVLANEGGIAENGLKRALHICRGHFAHYSEDRPLFGKYVGQFWVPAHVRGTSEAGAVQKDYAVDAPRESA